MIESSLLHKSHNVTQNGFFQSPCSLWEQEFRISTDIRQPCFCLMQWCDRELTAFGMSLRTAPPEPLFSVGTGAQPLSVNRQPCLCVSLDCSQQLLQNCIGAWSFLNDLMVQYQFLKTLCVFKWSKCLNRQCRHPSFDHRDITEIMQIYCSCSVLVGYTKC